MEQIDLIQHTVQTLDALTIPYALVGSWGSGIYGEPRFTRDVDIVIDMSIGVVPQFCAAFPNGEFYLSEEAVQDAVRTRFQFNVLHPASGNKIDFIMTRPDAWNAGWPVDLSGSRPVSGSPTLPSKVLADQSPNPERFSHLFLKSPKHGISPLETTFCVGRAIDPPPPWGRLRNPPQSTRLCGLQFATGLGCLPDLKRIFLELWRLTRAKPGMRPHPEGQGGRTTPKSPNLALTGFSRIATTRPRAITWGTRLPT